MKRIMVTGAVGQIGSELTMVLREKYGNDNVIATGHKSKPGEKLLHSGPFQFINCLDIKTIDKVVKKYNVNTVYHLAALLSAVAEENPQLAWDVNINGLYNVLEVAREHNCAVFTPSSIGAFGPTTPLDNTPQDTIQRPNTMYGVTKVTGELLCDYYYKRFGVDTRGLRYPGIISCETLPGGGTTDYAVEIFYEAIKNKKYTCFLKHGTYLDMMYMPDAINSAINLMEADPAKLRHRNAFNVTAMSFDPKGIADEIKKIIPDFTIDYNVDPTRQAIAESWPNNMDDSAARKEWGWNPEYNLESMTKDMIEKLTVKLKKDNN
ncbi:MAG: L-threonine 3-dehydrogenase [Desulfobacterales bacterium]|nr:L-threonine 3-dehydrogenase [Desulfobacterales bacterium]MDX2510032.1 L-threonine 3-dehydrogenase [Desulfobacterales bacterium]